ncbi:hypothetical protein J6590_099759 [Homalodisca vitripennis]|nr:hypothetical protein J6590_099759 [Homalodisca vitripennis]
MFTANSYSSLPTAVMSGGPTQMDVSVPPQKKRGTHSKARSTAVIRSDVNILLLHVNIVFRLDTNQLKYSVNHFSTLLAASLCLLLYCSNPV